MKRRLTFFSGFLAMAALAGCFGAPAAAEPVKNAQTAAHEDYVHVAMPPDFQVEATELEGPVFADANGKTLYTWPYHSQRNGFAGEQKGKPACDGHVYTVNSGLMSPYPPGLLLPEIETRRSCIQEWPPVLADDSAKPVGRWTVVKRPDGSKQWAYDGAPLYTSIFDHRPGDANGGNARKYKNDSPAFRIPVGPPPSVPQQFAVDKVATGRLLVTNTHLSIYAWDKDGPDKSNCDAACTASWAPVLAPETAHADGDWSIFERAAGIKQWAFRKKPLYTHIGEKRLQSLEGSDAPGWHNVYTLPAPPPPKGFTVQDTRSGQVLADAHGRTIYIYNCQDDALDQLACDVPDSPQAYRFAVCGGGDPDRCLHTFPYVPAERDAKSTSRSWSIMNIDPKTGHLAAAGQADALRVWAYRDRPVYTFAGDHRPGDIGANDWGEAYGYRNGFRAFFLRDDFLDNAE